MYLLYFMSCLSTVGFYGAYEQSLKKSTFIYDKNVRKSATDPAGRSKFKLLSTSNISKESLALVKNTTVTKNGIDLELQSQTLCTDRSRVMQATDKSGLDYFGNERYLTRSGGYTFMAYDLLFPLVAYGSSSLSYTLQQEDYMSSIDKSPEDAANAMNPLVIPTLLVATTTGVNVATYMYLDNQLKKGKRNTIKEQFLCGEATGISDGSILGTVNGTSIPYTNASSKLSWEAKDLGIHFLKNPVNWNELSELTVSLTTEENVVFVSADQEKLLLEGNRLLMNNGSEVSSQKKKSRRRRRKAKSEVQEESFFHLDTRKQQTTQQIPTPQKSVQEWLCSSLENPEGKKVSMAYKLEKRFALLDFIEKNESCASSYKSLQDDVCSDYSEVFTKYSKKTHYTKTIIEGRYKKRIRKEKNIFDVSAFQESIKKSLLETKGRSIDLTSVKTHCANVPLDKVADNLFSNERKKDSDLEDFLTSVDNIKKIFGKDYTQDKKLYLPALKKRATQKVKDQASEYDFRDARKTTETYAELHFGKSWANSMNSIIKKYERQQVKEEKAREARRKRAADKAFRQCMKSLSGVFLCSGSPKYICGNRCGHNRLCKCCSYSSSQRKRMCGR